MSLTGKFLPIHPQPFEDELLTSWLVRVARNSGMKLETFAKQALQIKTQLWNRDLDRRPLDSAVIELSEKTGKSKNEINKLSLRVYEGKLYGYYHPSGILKWILPIKVHHRLRKGFGQQFCSECLKEDKTPYFRKRWRVSLNTFCHKHNTMLKDRCPNCKHPIMFYRQEIGKPDVSSSNEMCFCSVCEYDLRGSQNDPIEIYDDESFEWLININKALENNDADDNIFLKVDQFAVLRHFCKLATSNITGSSIQKHFQKKFSKHKITYSPNMNFFELHSINSRHEIIQIAIWILFDFEKRVEILWRNKIIRYNLFRKNFIECPDWYQEVVDKFNRRN